MQIFASTAPPAGGKGSTHPRLFCCTLQARRLLDSPAFFAAGAALYTVLLLAWLQCGALEAALAALRACSPLPNMARVAAAFLKAEVTTLAWLHLLLLDLFQARWSPVPALLHPTAAIWGCPLQGLQKLKGACSIRAVSGRALQYMQLTSWRWCTDTCCKPVSAAACLLGAQSCCASCLGSFVPPK